MPELPEVEVLVRHLRPLLRGKTVRSVEVRRARVLRPTGVKQFKKALMGARFAGLTRRGKYLLFELRRAGSLNPLRVAGHLGMTGRMYLLPRAEKLPAHTAVVFGLGRQNFVFEDTRYFGRMTLDISAISQLGLEPLSSEFTPKALAQGLRGSKQAIKVRLLDQNLVAGIGNIYASEALFRAGIPPTLPARDLGEGQVRRLWRAVREVLFEAIELGSTLPLNFTGAANRDRLFYYGSAPAAETVYEERLRVYDRAGKPCEICGTPIQRLVQAARSTFYCPRCQRA